MSQEVATPSASLHYTGLDGLWKSAAFWGSVGIVCQVLRPVPAVVLVMAVLGGLVTGSVCGWWLFKLKIRWIDPTCFAAVGIMILATMAHDSVHHILGYLAMGSFLSATISLTFLVLGKKALSHLNHKHTRLLETVGATPDPLPPLKKDAVSTRQAFLAALPQPLRDEIAATFVPAIVIEPGGISDELPAEASSFGGAPVLEPGLPWPCRDGRPMTFLARINLAEVANLLPDDAPRAGLLSFFFDPEQPWGGDPEDLGSGCILFAPDPAGCVPLENQREASARQAVEFRRKIVQHIPDELESRFYTHLRSLNPKEKTRLDILHERALETIQCDNRLLSPPHPVQNAMDSELRTASHAYGLIAEAKWIMVLQLDSVSEQGWCWGDAGCLYFWIPEDDWRAARFDRPWVVLQCT